MTWLLHEDLLSRVPRRTSQTSGEYGRSRPVRGLVARDILMAAVLLGGRGALCASAQQLPDAPSAVLEQAIAGDRQNSTQQGDESGRAQQVPQEKKLPLCPPSPGARNNKTLHTQGSTEVPPPSSAAAPGSEYCRNENQIQPIVTSGHANPLTPRGKATLAARDVLDPFNIVTILGYSGIAIAANSHSAYGPGFPGFGRLAGYSVVEDIQGEFFGTFLIPAVVHEDPRYHRMPDQTVPRRILHAIGHTYVSHHDDGTPMPNYATLLTYPISAELSNLYVPGVATNGPATAKRIAIGIGTDPAGTIVAEFLPDIAKRIHIHVIFVQEILNQVITGAPNMQ